MVANRPATAVQSAEPACSMETACRRRRSIDTSKCEAVNPSSMQAVPCSSVVSTPALNLSTQSCWAAPNDRYATATAWLFRDSPRTASRVEDEADEPSPQATPTTAKSRPTLHHRPRTQPAYPDRHVRRRSLAAAFAFPNYP